ncbi:MAG: hemolysin III [Planctomycetaceae bacterium]|nr:hemolysin III [Planctomycetaceae bacterium]
MLSGSSPSVSGPSTSASNWFDAEFANQLTHGFGAVLSVIGSVVLIRASLASGDVWAVIGCSVYSATLVLLYVMSTLSHSFEREKPRNLFRTMDQVCIFLLAAGSYTPVGVTIMRFGEWWLLLALIWGLAIAGSLYKLCVTKLENVPVWFYVLVGWLPILAIWPMAAEVGWTGTCLILSGALSYMIGTYFLVHDDRAPYFHALWHIWVIGGSTCHYFLHLLYVA